MMRMMRMGQKQKKFEQKYKIQDCVLDFDLSLVIKCSETKSACIFRIATECATIYDQIYGKKNNSPTEDRTPILNVRSSYTSHCTIGNHRLLYYGGRFYEFNC